MLSKRRRGHVPESKALQQAVHDRAGAATAGRKALPIVEAVRSVSPVRVAGTQVTSV